MQPIYKTSLLLRFCYYIIVVECVSSESSSESNLTKATSKIDSASRDGESFRTKRADKPVTQFLDGLLGERLFNTTMNFIVPGAKISLPRHTEEGSVDHLAMQAFFGIFWATAWLAFIAIPVSNTYFEPFGIARSFQNKRKSRNFKWKLSKDAAEMIGLEWDSCLQKSICQAHEFPEKYGVLGKTIQTLFPADKVDDNLIPYNRLFYKAAFNGAIGQDCTHIYNCFFDVLDVAMYMTSHFSATWLH